LEQRTPQVLAKGQTVWDVKYTSHSLLSKIARIFGEHETGLMKINQLARLRTKIIQCSFQLMTSLQISFTKQKAIISKE